MVNYYIVVIGSIRLSEKNAAPVSAKAQLLDILHDINNKYAEHVSAKFIITIENEFQGLMNNPKHIMDVIYEINTSLHPIAVRYGVGVGEISTDMNPDMAICADWPAFYSARKALEDVKQTEHRSRTAHTDMKIELSNGNPMKTNVINSALSLMFEQSKQWTDKQRKTIDIFKKSGEKQSTCAKKLNVNQSVISRQLSSANYYAYRDLSRSIVDFLLMEMDIRN